MAVIPELVRGIEIDKFQTLDKALPGISEKFFKGNFDHDQLRKELRTAKDQLLVVGVILLQAAKNHKGKWQGVIEEFALDDRSKGGDLQSHGYRLLRHALFTMYEKEKKKKEEERSKWFKLKMEEQIKPETIPSIDIVDRVFHRLCEQQNPRISPPVDCWSFIPWGKSKESLWRMQPTVTGVEVLYKTKDKKGKAGDFKYEGSLEELGRGIYCTLSNKAAKDSEREHVTFMAQKSNDHQWMEFMVGLSTCLDDHNDGVRSYKRVVISDRLMQDQGEKEVRETIRYYLAHDRGDLIRKFTDYQDFNDYVDQLRRKSQRGTAEELLEQLAQHAPFSTFNTFYPKQERWYQVRWTVERPSGEDSFQIIRESNTSGTWHCTNYRFVSKFLFLQMETPSKNAGGFVRWFIFDFRDFYNQETGILTLNSQSLVSGITLGINGQQRQLVSAKVIIAFRPNVLQGEKQEAHQSREIDMNQDYMKFDQDIKSLLPSPGASAIYTPLRKIFPENLEGSYRIYYKSYSSEKPFKVNTLRIHKTNSSVSHHFDCEDGDQRDRYYLAQSYIDGEAQNVLFLAFWDHVNRGYFCMHLVIKKAFLSPPQILVGNLSTKSKGKERPVAQAILLVREDLQAGEEPFDENLVPKFFRAFDNPVFHAEDKIFSLEELRDFLNRPFIATDPNSVIAKTKDLLRENSPVAYHRFMESLVEVGEELRFKKMLASKFLGTYKIFFNLMLVSLEKIIEERKESGVPMADPNTYSVVKVQHFWDAINLEISDKFKGDSPENASVRFPGTVNRIFLFDGTEITESYFHIVRDHFLAHQRRREEYDMFGELNICICLLGNMTDEGDMNRFSESFFTENITHTYYKVHTEGKIITSLEGLTVDEDEHNKLVKKFKELRGYDKKRRLKNVIIPVDKEFIDKIQANPPWKQGQE